MLCFDGIWVPLVTPFKSTPGRPKLTCSPSGGRAPQGGAFGGNVKHGGVDHPALHRLVTHLAQQGVAGFMPCGSTGEAAMLDQAEQDAVLATVLAAAGDKPVVMGLAGVRPQQVAQRAQLLAARHAVAGWLLTAPAYVKPSQAGIVDYFHTVADATPLPIVAYDIPARTGVRIAPATLRALAEHPNIQALKDCSGDRAAAESVLTDGRLALLCGNDDEMFDQLARGAVGAIAASAHLATAQFVLLHALLRDQRLTDARWLWRALAPITAAAFAEPNPAPLKAALAQQGWLLDELRAPMHPASQHTAATLLAAVAAVETLVSRQ